jgi:hypothetical protein
MEKENKYPERNITINTIDLLDVYLAGLDGDMGDFLFAFLRDKCKITYEDVKVFTISLL